MIGTVVSLVIALLLAASLALLLLTANLIRKNNKVAKTSREQRSENRALREPRAVHQSEHALERQRSLKPPAAYRPNYAYQHEPRYIFRGSLGQETSIANSSDVRVRGRELDIHNIQNERRRVHDLISAHHGVTVQKMGPIDLTSLVKRLANLADIDEESDQEDSIPRKVS